MSSSSAQGPPGRLRRIVRGVFGFAYRYGHLALPTAAAVLTVSSTYLILGPVLNRSGDNIYHLLNEYAMAHAIRVGDNPFGPLGMEFGQPVLRFYQALFYLQNVGISILTGLDLKFLHNLTIVVSFALSPFAYMYFLSKLGLNRWTASLGSFLSMISVAAFGNSFEAYHQAGIVTQSMGGLFFPWFMGNFIGMLRGENRASTTAFLFAMAFLSHAILSVFAVFAGALYFCVARVSIRANWKRFSAFALIGTALVAFWVMPFLAHTYEKRPVPDSIIRGQGVHWFTSVSQSELAMVLTTGRLLDDPPVKGEARNADDKFMDRISIIGTLKTRPPVFTLLTALGAALALLLLRRTPHRFLLAGFAFSLMLFAGPDDYRWLHYLPFMKQIQTFRCTYLVEFFAFGLAALGVEWTLRQLWNLVRTRRRFVRLPLTLSWIAIVGLGLFWVGTEIRLLGQVHLVIRDPWRLNQMIDACRNVPDRGHPHRMDVQFPGRRKIYHAWLSVYDFQPYCTHWKGTGPTAAFHLCSSLGSPSRNINLHSLAGIRWFTGKGDRIQPIVNAVDNDGDPQFERWPNGRDRHKKNNAAHQVRDSGREGFLRPLRGTPLPVVCTPNQWIWIAKSWSSRFATKLWDPNLPLAMRVPVGELDASGLLDAAPVLFYFDHSRLAADLPALRRYAEQGGRVITPVGIPGVDAVVTGTRSPWELLPKELRNLRGDRPPELEREELDPALEIAEIRRLDLWGRSRQNFLFDIDALEPLLYVLPMQQMPGWRAELDGEPLPLFSAGPDLIGVHLPAGAHRLGFHWEMPAFDRATIWASLAGLALVLGIWIRAFYRRASGRKWAR